MSTPVWHEPLQRAAWIDDFASLLGRGGAASGRAGSSTTMILAAVQQRTPGLRMLVTAHLDETDDALDELADLGIDAHRFPAMEILPGESAPRLDLLAERLAVMRMTRSSDAADAIIVAPIAALMQPIPALEELDDLIRTVRPGDHLDRDDLSSWLVERGWTRVANVERPGELAVRGDVLDVFPELGVPVRVDFLGDVVETLCAIDIDTMGSSQRLDRLDLIALGAAIDTDGLEDILPDLLGARWEVVLDDPLEIAEQSRSYQDRIAGGGWLCPLEDVQARLVERCRGVVLVGSEEAGADLSLPVSPLAAFPEQAAQALDDLRARTSSSNVTITCHNDGDEQRLGELLRGVTDVAIGRGWVHRGFTWTDGSRRYEVAGYHELVHRYHVHRRPHGSAARRELDAFVEIAPGDWVVHRDHGIASFVGLELSKRRADDPDEALEEFLVLEFAGSARLRIPATAIDDVQRYIGAFKGRPERSTLGSSAWKNRTSRVAEAVRDLASELLRVQAVRQSRTGIAFGPDGHWQSEFEAAFPWDETEDQLTAMTAIRGDMQSVRPMDRLLCGDVGFGKTEVAIRAAFRAVTAGRQVAVLVPTTVLAEQHERTFRDRFAGFPFVVESLSRFKTTAQQRELLERLAAGIVDVVIGTHRLLSADVAFGDLGLVVVDEEQRFGVEHKQRLLEMRATVDVLTMTATPIPRTLHMSMVGLRDISSLQTPPVDRRAVMTEVMPWNGDRLREALRRELAREGQVFVVHNRVADLDDVADAIMKLVPDARIVTGHGQMAARELEATMLAFMRHEVDILVSTTIVESGIDIPNANTIIINEADRFGLAELHQLRGRVGRSRNRAYCYLLLPMRRTVNPDARRRLRAIENFSMLGAGFRIALRDLEIRGAGNLLGPEQSGHISAVGYELYCRLLERAVADLKEGRRVDEVRTVIDTTWRGYLPKAWIPADARRMDAYRRMCRAQDSAALDEVVVALESAYGALPPPASRLRQLAELRVLVSGFGVVSLVRREDDLILRTSRHEPLMAAMHEVAGKVRVVGNPAADGTREVWWRPPRSGMDLGTVAAVLRRRLAASRPVGIA